MIAKKIFVRLIKKLSNTLLLVKSTGIWDHYTEDALALSKVHNCSDYSLKINQQKPELLSKNIQDRFCNWYLPIFDNPFYGGVMTILRLSSYLYDHYGIKQRFLMCGNVNNDQITNLIISVFPNLSHCKVIVLNSCEAIKSIPFSDYSIATLWTTAYVLLNIENTALKFYMIQDFEPLFYPAGSTYAQAELTYKFGFYGIANTISLSEIYNKNYGGQSVVLTPNIDTSIFYHKDDSLRNNKKKIFYYARPGIPRNAFELACTAFILLKQKYNDSIEIICAGANWNAKDYGLNDVVTNIGLLPYKETGDLYRSCHIGLSMMITHHPSYLPFELMACGVLLVANKNPANYWLLKDGENCLLTEPSPYYIFEVIDKAIENYESYNFIRDNASKLIYKDYSDWNKSMEKVGSYILNIGQN